MKPSEKGNSPILPSSDDSADLSQDSRGKRSGKQARTDAKRKSVGSKRELRRKERTDRSSGIRETEEARALLEDQLHSLYWWVFNACKMKGFIRAKELHLTAESRLDASGNAWRTNR